MLATFAFDICFEVYRGARAVLDEKIATLNLESSGKYMWHPDRVPRLAEFVADFARAGERALGEIRQHDARTKRRGDSGAAAAGERLLAPSSVERDGDRREIPRSARDDNVEAGGVMGCAGNDNVKAGGVSRSAQNGDVETVGVPDFAQNDYLEAGCISRCAPNDNVAAREGVRRAARFTESVHRERNDGGVGSASVGRASPSGSLRASRLVMFRMFYLGGAEYHAARRHLGISEFTWADWSDEIRARVGRELVRAGMFPPSKYFQQSSDPKEEDSAA